MRVIGLTGGIASGKSTVASYLREWGAVIIDADILARELVCPGSLAWQKIMAHFGAEIITSHGLLDRNKLGKIIFASPTQRQVLNGILHPQIKERMIELIEVTRQKKDVPVVVVVAPLLIEAGMTAMVEEIWLVVLPEKLQLQRLLKRDQLSPLAAQKRIRAQLPVGEKIKYASRIIDNSGSPAKTKEIVWAMWQKVIGRDPI